MSKEEPINYFTKDGTIEEQIAADKKSTNPKYSPEMDEMIAAITKWKDIRKKKGFDSALLVGFLSWDKESWKKVKNGYELRTTETVMFGHGPFQMREQILQNMIEAQSKSKK